MLHIQEAGRDVPSSKLQHIQWHNHRKTACRGPGGGTLPPYQEGSVPFSMGGCYIPHLTPQVSLEFHRWFSNCRSESSKCKYCSLWDLQMQTMKECLYVRRFLLASLPNQLSQNTLLNASVVFTPIMFHQRHSIQALQGELTCKVMAFRINSSIN